MYPPDDCIFRFMFLIYPQVPAFGFRTHPQVTRSLCTIRGGFKGCPHQ